MALVLVGFVLTMVGVALASNMFDFAGKAAHFNEALRGLRVNSRPSTWRLTGGLFAAVGVLLTLWSEPQPSDLSAVVGRLLLGSFGVVILHDVLSWSESWVLNGRFIGGWIRHQSMTAQVLWRMSTGIIACFALLGAFFGTVVTPSTGR
jgi:hypothetical protein